MLRVEDLQTTLFTRRGSLKAVKGVSFTLEAGKTLGLVGESGSGKTMTCLSILGLLPAGGRIVGGHIWYDGTDLAALSQREICAFRGRHIAMILQDPLSSLNPVLTVGEQVAEPYQLHWRMTPSSAWEHAVEALGRVRIPAAAVVARSYPHQLSGGMRQRAVGAIALAGGPRVLIADEPTTALDATIQAQYLNLLIDLQREHGLGILFVTHDLGIVAHMCDRVAVMYAGVIVETASVEELFDAPAHPYSAALLRSIPDVESPPDRLQSIEGQPPPLHQLPPGCSFAPRCAYADDRCRTHIPPAVEVTPDHVARCWHVDRVQGTRL